MEMEDIEVRILKDYIYHNLMRLYTSDKWENGYGYFVVRVDVEKYTDLDELYTILHQNQEIMDKLNQAAPIGSDGDFDKYLYEVSGRILEIHKLCVSAEISLVYIYKYDNDNVGESPILVIGE